MFTVFINVLQTNLKIETFEKRHGYNFESSQLKFWNNTKEHEY